MTLLGGGGGGGGELIQQELSGTGSQQTQKLNQIRKIIKSLDFFSIPSKRIVTEVFVQAL